MMKIGRAPLGFSGLGQFFAAESNIQHREVGGFSQKPDPDEQFRFGMEILKNGLASYLIRKKK